MLTSTKPIKPAKEYPKKCFRNQHGPSPIFASAVPLRGPERPP
ncbi:hypothetical protein SAMN05216281_1673 [Cryobacterium luteum]|nr:hypothetical protein SAMN05216281_1673 [Cryobacterium luteum]